MSGTHTFKGIWARKRRLMGAGFAVIIGVAFLTATLVLGDGMKSGIHDLFAEGHSGTDAMVRSSIEIGGIYWGLPMARSRLATEALYLFARHAFDDLGYRRFEWKCNDRNGPSKAAATRFGFQFEGVFRQDMIIKGVSRDTAWFSIIDDEWPSMRAEYERWLAPDNFGADGVQKSKLKTR